MVRCARCGAKVSKKRLVNEKGSKYAGFFCSTTCHVEYADEMIGLFRTAEQEAEEELQAEVAEGQPWARQVLEDIDAAAAEATLEGQRPQEIAARFLGKVAGKFATNLYAKFERTARSWAESRKATNESESEAEDGPRPRPAPKQQPRQERNGKGHRNGSASERQPAQGSNGAQPPKQPASTKPSGPPPGTQKKPDPRNPTGEPADLEELPLEEQRDWLLKRFIFLKPNPTWDELTKEWRKLSLKYHPDNRRTGNVGAAAIVNSTYQRLKEIKEEIGWPN